MALLAETLVEEWFNRKGYFTIRGIKVSIDEIDILAIKNIGNAWDCIHCEVQVGINPMNYISKLTNELRVSKNAKNRSSAIKRTDEELIECVNKWVDNKYINKKKVDVRNSIFKGAEWKYKLVHGNVYDKKELEFITGYGVELIPIEIILSDLCNDNDSNFKASPAGDFVDLIKLYKERGG